MSCRDMDRLIQLYVDQEIDEADRTRLRGHVSGCEDCRRNLQEMIHLVQSLEEIRQYSLPARPTPASSFIKWTAVYTAIAFLVCFAPVMEHHQDRLAEPSPAGTGTVVSQETAETVQKKLQVLVLATQSEKLHIPSGDYIRVIPPRNLQGNLSTDTAWIYPSAMPFLLKDNDNWYKHMRRLVFVSVPDNDTFRTLLASVGLKLDERSALKDVAFPTSVILTTGKNPQVETFTFPDNEKNISRWFDKLATTPQPIH